MAREREALEPYRLEGVQETGKELGHGSYATVVEVIYKGLHCAGKKIHRVLYEQRVGDLVQRFEGECRLLSQLRHPHVVQFLGVYFDRETNVPVLVMEFLPTTLAECLDRYGVLPNEISYSVLHDVALGLRYLHGQVPPIIHRDLSANNVLLTVDMVAKISDLGVAKILNLTPAQMTQLTQAPGTPCYMPPEALVPNPSYTASIDVFSCGNMIIHVFSGKWPLPTEAARVNPNNPNNPNELLPVSEAERRQSYLDDMGRDHPLRRLAVQCLSNNPSHRPTASEIHERMNVVCVRFSTSFTNKVEMLQQIKADSKEKQLLRQEKEQLSNDTAPLEEEMDRLRLMSSVQVEQLQLEVAELKSSLAQQESELRAEIRGKEAEISEHQAEMRALEASKNAMEASKNAMESSKNAIIASKEEVIALKATALDRKDATISGLNQQIDRLQHCVASKELPHLFHPDARLQWQTGPPLPENICGSHSVVIGGVLYTRYNYQVFQCDSREQWTTLPSLPYKYFGLGQLSGQLVAIGGNVGEFHATNKVHMFDAMLNEWKESLPPMPHACYCPAVISYNSALVVCGGERDKQPFTSVDIYKSEASQWYSASSLPFPWSVMKSTVIGERCYLMGGYTGTTNDSGTKAVLSASLPALLDAVCPSNDGQSPSTEQTVWTRLPDAPLFHSTPASIGGSLLALGGQSKSHRGTVSKSVYVYSPTTSSWIQIQDLPAPRKTIIAVTISSELRIIGGKDRESKMTNTVFKATILI